MKRITFGLALATCRREGFSNLSRMVAHNMRNTGSRLSSLLLISIFLNPIACGDIASVEDAPEPRHRQGVGTLKNDTSTKADTSCGEFTSDYFEFLDDTRCSKRRPTNTARNFVCPNQATHPTVFSPLHGHEVSYEPATASPTIDETALVGVVPDDLRVTLILVRRVDGRPYYRYLSNGRHKETFQPWSATKFMAVANAGSTLRHLSNGQVGLTATVDDLPIGDLISIVHNYDERDYSSNGLARWFLNVGNRSRLNALIHADWLKRPWWESIGGNYGQRAAKVGYSFVDASASLHVDGIDGHGPSNRLSTYTIAEFLKRIVMHREDPELALPRLTWPDVETLLYGAATSRIYHNNQPQGMEADTAVYLQSALDMDHIEERSRGQWRIFSKLGFGFQRGGEFVNAAYGCFPAFDDAGATMVDWGKEFFIVTQANGRGRYHQTDKMIADIYRRVVGAIMDGSIK